MGAICCVQDHDQTNCKVVQVVTEQNEVDDYRDYSKDAVF